MYTLIDRFRDHLGLPPDLRPISLGEGNTPLLPLDLVPDIHLFVKVEGMNPTGSFKDRGMTVAASVAIHEGATGFVCASTGNTAASAAAYGGRAGVPVTVLLPRGAVAPGKIAQSVAAGARLLEIDGNFDAALRALRRVIERRPTLALVNSVNPWRLVGQRTSSFEIVEQLGGRPPDVLMLPVGNAGNISAYGQGFSHLKKIGTIDRLPRLVGVQAEGAAAMVLGRDIPEPQTVASAIRIGAPASRHLAEEAASQSGGFFLKVSDDELLDAYKALAACGVFCESASSVPLAGLRKLVAKGEIPKGSVVVLVTTGHGLKDPELPLTLRPQPFEPIAATEIALMDALSGS